MRKLNKENCIYLPKSIKAFIATFELGKSGKDNEFTQKVNRMREYWESSFENGEKLNKAWRKLEKYALNDDKLVSLFMLLPSSLTKQPFKLSHYERNKDPTQEKQDLNELIDSIDKIKAFFAFTTYTHRKSPNFWFACADASFTNTKECMFALNEFRKIETQLIQGLFKFEEFLKTIDPSAKYLGSQWYSPDAEKHVYHCLLANLNRYLKNPQHSAIAIVANANMPNIQVNGDAIRKAYERRTKEEEIIL